MKKRTRIAVRNITMEVLGGVLTFLGSIKNSCWTSSSERAAVYALWPALSITLLQTRRRHSSLRISLSVHSLCQVGVISHNGANSCTMLQE